MLTPHAGERTFDLRLLRAEDAGFHFAEAIHRGGRVCLAIKMAYV